MVGDDDTLFQGLFPKRQLWQSRMPHHALWDKNWDQEMETRSSGKEEVNVIDAMNRERELRRRGVTRHIILIRHGQYDESQPEDENRLLTPLGREQADKTGKRLAEIVRGIDEKFGPCNVKAIRVSDLCRAKETADIIAAHLPGIERTDPDPLLNEGRPCHNIPGGKARSSVVEKVDEHHPRIEKAFRKYFHRAPAPLPLSNENDDDDNKPELIFESVVGDPKHEFEIIVCHANVIRYFFCRALQLPPEIWLRLCTFNCSLTYFTIRPTGTVSCRMLGDIGHLGYDNSTFSMHHGFNW